MTGHYKDDGHIYIQGLVDQDELKYIYVLYLLEVEDDTPDGEDGDDPADEDDVEIPAWMVPPIKKLILNNEITHQWPPSTMVIRAVTSSMSIPPWPSTLA